MCARVCAWWATCACACAAALLLAAAHHAPADPKPLSPMPFLIEMRYGRSATPLRHLVPRFDSFFVKARYGKRSAAGAGGAGSAAAHALLCEFTGVSPLYRCRHPPDPYDKRSAEDAGDRWEE